MTDLRIDVSDLLTHPGSRRPLHREATVEGLGGSARAVDEPVLLDLVLERVPDGVVARGMVRAHWAGDCSVCLREISSDLDVAVGGELFVPHAVDGETYPLLGREIDLEQLVRDAVLLELPLAPTCASIGAQPCRAPSVNDDDDDAPVDPRWAALSELEL